MFTLCKREQVLRYLFLEKYRILNIGTYGILSNDGNSCILVRYAGTDEPDLRENAHKLYNSNEKNIEEDSYEYVNIISQKMNASEAKRWLLNIAE